MSPAPSRNVDSQIHSEGVILKPRVLTSGAKDLARTIKLSGIEH